MGLLEKFTNLDDKTFEELVKEARSLIPRYAPEWTDHNIHDPGITFIELFAWIAEMEIYQLNRITDANYKKFLRLVGLYPYGAQPARVDITFDVKNDTRIEKGDQIITGIGSEKMVFEAMEDFNLIKANIKSVITRLGTQIIDNTQANEKEDIYFTAFGENAQERATLEIGFDIPLPKKEIQIMVVLFEKDLPSLNTDGEPIPSVRVVWEYWSGGKWKRLALRKDTTLALTRSGRIIFDGQPSMDKKDEYYWIRCRLNKGHYEILPLIDTILLNTIPAIQIETIQNEDLGTGFGIPDQKVRLEKVPINKRDILDFSQFYVRDILNWPGLLKALKDQIKSDKSNPGKRIWDISDPDFKNLIAKWDETQTPDSELKYSTIAALNRALESRELYDTESFKEINLNSGIKKLIEHLNILSEIEVKELNRFLIEAAYPGKITSDSPIIQVEGENHEWETWIEVENFEASCPNDAHYILTPENQEITFGNGLNGRIPLKSHGIRAYYKTTSGLKGNISKEQRWMIIGESGSIYGKNLREATGGKDAEPVEHAEARAKNELRTISRAITSNDYEKLACSTPGLRVARAKAIPDYNRDYPCVSIPGSVTVVVVPSARGDRVTPVPGEGFLQTISRYLDTHRLITTDLHVVAPEYVKVSVMCKVHITKKNSQTEVEKRIKKKLNEFLNPLKGGPDKRGWPFGRAVYPSEIYQIIDEVEGVDYATNISLSAESADGQYRKAGDIIKISPVALVCSGEHRVITTDQRIEYVRIAVRCYIHIKEKDNPIEVKRRVEKALEMFLDPLKGGQDGKGWPFGKEVRLSEIYKKIRNVDGVESITDVSTCAEGRQYQKDTIKIPETALVVSDKHQVKIVETEGENDAARIQDPGF